jgi:putative polyhydroxyalkanoate system protein
MSDVVVNQAHNVSADEAKKRIADFEEMLTKYGVKVDWKGNTGTLKGTGVSGGIDIGPSNVKVEVKLGMMAKAIGVDATKLRGSIEKRLKAAFEAQG